MKKRPTSAVGYKRPISQYARVAIAMRAHSRYRVGVCVLLQDVKDDHEPLVCDNYFIMKGIEFH